MGAYLSSLPPQGPVDESSSPLALTEQPSNVIDVVQGLVGVLAQADNIVEEVGAQFTSVPQVSEDVQLARDAIRRLLGTIIQTAETGQRDQASPVI